MRSPASDRGVLLGLVLSLARVGGPPACAEVVRLTDASAFGTRPSTRAFGAHPQINRAGRVVWEGGLFRDEQEISLWDGAGGRQLTADNRQDALPRINDAGDVLWQSMDNNRATILLWNGKSTRVIASDGRDPQMNNAGQVVWEGWDGSDSEIYLWDGKTVRQITDNRAPDRKPQINNAGQVVWESEGQIYLWSGGTCEPLTDGSPYHYNPRINDAGWVVWEATDGRWRWQIYLCDGTTIRQLSNSGDNHNPQINRAGQVVWVRWDGSDSEICLWNRGTRQLTNNKIDDRNPSLNDAGQVVWEAGYFLDAEIYLWNGTAIQRLTANGESDQNPQINRAGQVVWQNGAGEIYLYTPGVPGAPALLPSPSSVLGGWPTRGTITLGGPAPPGGLVVRLSSSDPAVTVPASVTVPAGVISTALPLTTHPVAASTAVLLSATVGGVTCTGTMTVQPPYLSSVGSNPGGGIGGRATQGYVSLGGAAPPDGVVVTLSSGSPAVAAVPASVTVPPGVSYALFPITTFPVAALTPVTLAASFGGVTRTATLGVLPEPIAAVALHPNPVPGGTVCTGVVTLSAPARLGSTRITLTSSNPAVAAVPAAVTVPCGQTSASFTVVTSRVQTVTSVSISADAWGIARTATLTVQP